MKRSMLPRITYLLLLLIATAPFALHAQSRSTQLVQVLVSPDKPDWTYKAGEPATFTVTVLQHQVPLQGAEITFTIGPEKMEPVQTGTMTLQSGSAQVGEPASMDEPGFLRCEVLVNVDGESYKGIATAGFDPEAIQPTQVLPDDFKEFWDRAKTELATLPVDAKLKLLPERCTETVNVYEINMQNYPTGARLYGILAKPKKEGKYPAVLQVPGAGIRPYPGIIDIAEKGIITLQIGIHGIPVTYENTLYSNLSSAALRGYQFFNLDDRDHYYYKRVYLGCVRAIDYLTSLPEYEGNNLIVWGGSQGGALSIVTTALDDRVTALVSRYPALCDLTGYLHDRAGGWPHMFNKRNAPYMAKEDKIKVSGYYDVVNFAKLIDVPGFYTWGYNDDTCPPTSMYSAYNQIQAPKELYLVQETGHWTYPEQREKVKQWVIKAAGK